MASTPQNTAQTLQITDREVSVGINTKITLCESNPSRVYLLFSTRTDNLCTIRPLKQASTDIGLALDELKKHEVTWRLHGSLVNCQWYAYSDAGCTVYVQEVAYIPDRG